MKKILFLCLIVIGFFISTVRGGSPAYPAFLPSGDNLINITQDGLVIVNRTTGDTIMVITGAEFMFADTANDTSLMITGGIAKFFDSLHVEDSLYAGWAYINGTLESGGNAVIGGTLTTGGNVTVGGTLVTIGGSSEVVAGLNLVTTDGTFSFFYDVSSGALISAGNFEVQGALDVSGVVTLDDIQSRNGIDVDILIGATKEVSITSTGLQVLDGSINVSNSITAGGTAIIDQGVYNNVLTTDSVLTSKHYSDHYFLDDSVVIPANIGNGWIITRDSVNGRWDLSANVGSDTGIVAYGEMHDSVGGSVFNHLATSTFYPWFTNVDGGDLKNVGFITPGDTARLIVDSAGVYIVALTTSFSGVNSATYDAHLFINSTSQAHLGFERKLGTGGDIGSAGFHGLVDLTAGDTIDIRISSDATGNRTTHDGNLSIHLLSRTGVAGGGSSSISVDGGDVTDPNFIGGNMIDYTVASSNVTTSVDTVELDAFIDTANVRYADSSGHSDSAGVVASENIDYSAISIPNLALQADVSLLGQNIQNSEISNNEIESGKFSQTAKHFFSALVFLNDTLISDSALMTKDYIDGLVALDTTGFMQNTGDTVTGTYRIDGEVQLTGNNDIVMNKDSSGLSSSIVWHRPSLPSVSFGYNETFNYFSISDSLRMGGRKIFNVADPVNITDVATKNYVDTVTIPFADSAGTVTDSAITGQKIISSAISTIHIAQNGASSGQMLKWNGSAWVASNDLQGSGAWTEDGDSLQLLINTTGDSMLFVELVAGGVDPDTVKLYTADGKVLMIGREDLAIFDSLSMGGDTLNDFAGFGLTVVARALVLDTAWMNANFKIATASLADVATLATTASDVDTTGTDIATALGNKMYNVGDTVSGTYDFSQGDLEDIDAIRADTLNLSSGENLFFNTGDSRFEVSDAFHATGNITAPEGFFSTSNSFFSNSSGTAGRFGLYSWDGGSSTGGHLLFSAAGDNWWSSDPIFIGDTTIPDSMLATKEYVKNQVSTPTLNNVTIAGDLSATGYINRWMHGTDLDISDAWAINGVEFKLFADTTPTADSAFLHPSVLYIAEGFLGYKLWMITTSSVGDGEEGFVWVTNTFDTATGHPINWHEFIDSSGGTVGTGDTLINPLFSRFDYTGTITDCHLFFGHDSKLWSFIRIGRGSITVGQDSSLFIARNTLDGLTWSTPDTIFTEIAEGVNIGNLSPTIFLDTNSTYKMFFVARDTSAAEINKVVLYSAPDPSGPWTFIDTTDMAPTNEASRDIWHLNIVPYSPDYYLSLIYESASGTQSQGGISISESRDGGLSWSSAKQVLSHTNGDPTWDDFTLYRAAGYWFEQAGQMAMKLIYSAKYDQHDSTWGTGVTDLNFYDSTTFIASSLQDANNDLKIINLGFLKDTAWLKADTGTSIGIASKDFVRDSTLMSGTFQQTVHIAVDFLPGRRGIPGGSTDSVHLSLPIMKDIYATLAKDSSVGASSFDRDTIYYSFTMPFDLVSVDSVIFTHIASTATSTAIQDLYVVTPDQSSGSVMADSVHATDLTTDLTDVTWAEERIEIDLSMVNSGEQFVLRMTNVIDNGQNIWIGRMYLICTVNITL